jgi:hypothetical protein
MSAFDLPASAWPEARAMKARLRFLRSSLLERELGSDVRAVRAEIEDLQQRLYREARP